jgi:hypothetical protein
MTSPLRCASSNKTLRPLSGSWPIHGFYFACAIRRQAAPLVVVFDEWVPQISASCSLIDYSVLVNEAGKAELGVRRIAA